MIGKSPRHQGRVAATGSAHHGYNPEKRLILEQDLKKAASANGFLGGLVFDLQCGIVAHSDAQVEKDIELKTICNNVYRTRSFHVLASGLDRGDVRLTFAVPVFADLKQSPAGKKVPTIVGIVALVTNPWKNLLPFFVPEGEPARSLETSLIWKRQDQVVIFFPARAARGEKAVVVRPLKDVSYEGRVAVGSGLAFGEFKDFRGVRVFSVVKQIPMSGDHLARTIDRDEALRSSQEMFFKAFHSSPEPVSIMTLGEGRFIDVNKAFCDQLGYAHSEVIGTSWTNWDSSRSPS